jgi:membrane-associated phospholipid phosphatase
MLEPAQIFFSEKIIIYLQSHGNPFLDYLFLVITTLGSQPAYLFLASLIFWCFGKKTGIRALYVILFSAFAAIFAKNLFAMPRPPEYLHKIQENDFGFPSGHAFVSSGFWGYLGGMIKNYWLIFVGAVAILSISLSRIYLGVHYLGDVVGGIIFGLLMALISLKAEPGITSRLEKLGRIPGYFVALMLPVILVAIAIMQRIILMEQEEVGLVMAGIGAGYLLEEERVRFADATNNKQRIKRAVMGIVVLGIIYLISSVLLSINPNFIFFKYAALGFASTFIAPWVITKIEV